MSADGITDRNRANAKKSTGPTTSEGKAIVADNARRHGATARPDPCNVAAWLSVILDRPEITPRDLMPANEAGYRALALAEAEARLVAAERALREFEAGEADPDETTRDLRERADAMMEELIETGGTVRVVRSGLSIVRRIVRIEADDTALGGKRHRLLRRYVREARAGRRHAFEAWAAGRASHAAAASLLP